MFRSCRGARPFETGIVLSIPLLRKLLTNLFWQFAFAFERGAQVNSLLELDSNSEPTYRRLWVCCRRKTNTVPQKDQYRLKDHPPKDSGTAGEDPNEVEVYVTDWIDEKDLEVFPGQG